MLQVYIRLYHTPFSEHWSTEETTLECIEDMIVPFYAAKSDKLGKEQPGLVMYNFRGQITECSYHVQYSHAEITIEHNRSFTTHAVVS